MKYFNIWNDKNNCLETFVIRETKQGYELHKLDKETSKKGGINIYDKICVINNKDIETSKQLEELAKNYIL